MNALVYSLCALEQHLGRRLLPPTFHVVPGRSLSAYRALGFCLDGDSLTPGRTLLSLLTLFCPN